MPPESLPRVTTTTSSEFRFGYQCKVAQLRTWLSGLPDDAVITVSKYKGDAREPDVTTLRAQFPAVMG